MQSLSFDGWDPMRAEAAKHTIHHAAPGTIVTLIQPPTAIIIKLPDADPKQYPATLERGHVVLPFTMSKRAEKVRMLPFMTYASDYINVTRIPVVIAHACTFEKVQGLTVDRCIVNVSPFQKPPLTFEKLNVALTRPTTNAGLRVLPTVDKNGEKHTHVSVSHITNN